MSCKYCKKDAVYKCSVCGRLICGEHMKLRTICPACMEKATLKYIIDKANRDKERRNIREFVKRFLGEQEQLTFGKRYIVEKLPAYIAEAEDHIIGFASFAEAGDAILIAALGILPKYQGYGVGSSLVEKVEDEAKKLRKKKLLVSTSNDDIPALTFYQSLGFQIYEVKSNVIAEKHGRVLKGIGGLPIRDELRLQKIIH